MPPPDGATNVPPEQCPECGRFLSSGFVDEATPGPLPCPNCATPLSFRTAGDGGAVPGTITPPATPPEDPPGAADTEAVAAAHPLDSWGAGATAPPLVDEPVLALTPDELALAGGGALLGALLVRRSRILGAIVGAAAAVLTLLARRD